MASVNVKCTCGKQFAGEPAEATGFSVICPFCGTGHRIKPPGVPRDQFKNAAASSTERTAVQIEFTDFYKVWTSSADGCSCSLCSKLEGTAVKYNEPFEIAGRSVMEPPLHDKCRCSVLWVEKSLLEPDLVRLYNAFVIFSSAASSSVSFQSFISCFFAAEYFLGKLASAPAGDLVAAGLAGNDFKAQSLDLRLRRDQLFNDAIKRSFDHEWESAKLLKTERGRRARMDQWVQLVVSTQALAPANYEYLKELFSNV